MIDLEEPAPAPKADWDVPPIDWGNIPAGAVVGQFHLGGLEAVKVGDELVVPPAVAHLDNDAEEHPFDAAEVDENGEPY